MDDLNYPYMCETHVNTILRILEKVSPIRCFEWGAGGSTWYFPRYILGIATWTAIEHDRTWFEKERTMGRTVRQGVEIHLVEDLEAYINFMNSFTLALIGSLYQKYDFILVDGEHSTREACFEIALGKLSGEGVLLLHDAERYKKGLLPEGWFGCLVGQKVKDPDGNISESQLLVASKREALIREIHA